MTTPVVAIVLGRAGSKGLPGKNWRPVAGRPMIQHTILHARAATSVGRIVVSTDGDEISAAAEAARDPDLVVVRRPAELATDNASVAAAALHAYETEGGDTPIVVILYANVPVRPAGLIDRAVRRLTETGADSVQSYCPVGRHHPVWMVSLDEEGRVVPYAEGTVDRRQDLPSLSLPDGGVIAVTAGSLKADGQGGPHDFLGRDRRGIETAAGDVVDVDTEHDLALAEALLGRRQTIGATS